MILRREVIGNQTDVIRVPLSQGYVATVDAADAELIAGQKWSATVQLRSDGSVRAVYAQRRQVVNGIKRPVLMHRVIAGETQGLEVDHIDGDGLNNTRANLRLVSRAQNAHNRKPQANTLTGLKGVAFDGRKGRWVARIMRDGKRFYLGYFDSADKAGAAYAEASARIHGEFGRSA